MGLRFVLVHSPSVGPSTWTPVADWLRGEGHEARVADLSGIGQTKPPFWPVIAARVEETILRTGDRASSVVAMHSNAGLFASNIAAASPEHVAGLIFVDASIPPDSGEVEVVPAELLAHLRTMAKDGWLPRWTDWWAEEDVAPLFPDPATRRRISEEQPKLPLSYYEQKIPVAPGWADTPCGYLLFGPPYDEVARQARARGWPVEHIPGEHLHMIVDPKGVGRALVELAADLPSKERA